MKIKILNPKVTLYYQPIILEDTETLLSQDTEFSYLLKKTHLSKITHFLSYLYMKPLMDKTYQHRFEFIYICAEFMEKMYGERYYKDILKALIKHDIIEESPYSYKVGERTKAYRLHYKYIGLRFQAATADRKIAKKQIAYRVQKENASVYGDSVKNSKQVIAKLKRTLQKIVIDSQAAEQHVFENLVSALQNPDGIEVKKHKFWKKGKFYPDPYKALTAEQAQTMYTRLMAAAKNIVGADAIIQQPMTLKQLQTALNKYQADMSGVTRIANKDFTFHPDDKAGRIHTNLTSIRSDLRKYITLNDETLMGRDLVSSQPVFLACMLLKRYEDIEMPDDAFRFIDRCLDGGANGPDIYQYIMEKHGKKNRKKFKTQFYKKILFGKIPKTLKGIAKIFAVEFPTVWGFINELKKDDYTQLAINLQKLEARMFIGAAEEVVKHGVEVLTLHDALYTAPEHAALVDKIILSRFMKEYGVKPRISE